MAEAVEIESGKKNDRPRLIEALRLCRLHNATLVIAKLDRLSRDAHFLLGLEKAGVEFVAADMPSANRLTAGIMAMVADEERRMISRRTKDALAAAKARGKMLGSVASTCQATGSSGERGWKARYGLFLAYLMQQSRRYGRVLLHG
jgi:DNA invertase Pin-like site-specific DNA recombinase